MKVLISGGTGFIGRRILQKIEASEIYVITRDKSRARDLLGSQYQFIEWNTEQKKIDLPDVDAVIHLSGEPIAQKWTKLSKERIYNSRVKGTESLVSNLLRKNQTARFISASGIGFYGQTGSQRVDENSAKGDGFLADICQDWENALHPLKTSGWQVTAVRIGVVLDAKFGALEKMVKPFKYGLGAALGPGDQYMSWIHIEDLVDLFLWLLKEKEPPKLINAVANASTNLEVSQSIAEKMSRFRWPNVPGPVLKLVLGEMAELVLCSQRVESVGKFSPKFRDINTAIADLL